MNLKIIKYLKFKVYDESAEDLVNDDGRASYIIIGILTLINLFTLNQRFIVV